MNVTAQKIQSQNWPVYKSLASINHRTTLPQSALRAASSLREGAGNGFHHSTGYSLKSGVGGRFSSPLRNSDDFGLYHSSDDTPSVSPSGCQLPQRGSRERLYHPSDCSLKSGVTGDFHRPYEALMSLGFTVQWWGTRVYPKLSFSPWETLWHRSRKVSWLMVATEEGSCTGPVAMVPFSPGRVPPAREAAHRSRAYRAA